MHLNAAKVKYKQKYVKMPAVVSIQINTFSYVLDE